MALKKATRMAQTVLAAEFKWTYADTMVNSAGVTKDFGKTDVAEENAFDVIQLPPGAVVVGGEVTRDVAFDTAGYDIEIGDATTDDRYLASADLKAKGTTPLVPTGFVGTGEAIRMTVQSDDVCTAGSATLRVLYVIDGRVSEVS